MGWNGLAYSVAHDVLSLLVNLEDFSLFNKTRTQKLSFNDTVAIQLVVKSNTLLGFEKKSFPPNTAL